MIVLKSSWPDQKGLFGHLVRFGEVNQAGQRFFFSSDTHTNLFDRTTVTDNQNESKERPETL